MGRRSINTTKSGKYMNPTDQARKEARKKELKKNKKQRQLVRAAVLKGKDPQQLIQDLEKIDQMEYNVLQPSPLNEKVLKDKRKKLKDTLDRVLKMYNKDDPDKWAELKREQVDYERKRTTLFNYFESVKNAQQVQVDDIPLPINALPAELQAVFVGMPSQIPLPTALAPPLISSLLKAPTGILKKTSAYHASMPKKGPPGVPPGPPPTLEELELEEEPTEEQPKEILDIPAATQKKTIRFADEDLMEVDTEALKPNALGAVKLVDADEDDDDDDMEEELAHSPEAMPTVNDSNPRPTSLQQRMLAMAGQDIDQFMKEMEHVHRKRRINRAADLEARLQAVGDPEADEKTQGSSMMPSKESMMMEPRTQLPMSLLPGLPPMMFRPPPRVMPSLLGIRLPPGPPPGLPPGMGIRLPPGPPPGLPPGLMLPPSMPMMAPQPAQSNVLSAAPQLISRPESSGSTIQAQAKIRNLSADVTRFLPTALRVKRDEKNKPKAKTTSTPDPKLEIIQPPPKPQQSKDDAYKLFMQEMEGLI